jgi:putative transposase
VLNRQFTENRPNQKWVDDFTYIWTAEGWLYVAAVIDLLSRRVVGWSMNANMTAQLVTDALIMAFWRRGNQMHSCIILIKEANIRASSSSVS